MRKWRVLFLLLPAVGMVCSLPTDDPPLSWNSTLDLPFTNDTFYIAEELAKGDMGTMRVTGIEDTVTGDTVALTVVDSSTIDIEHELYNLDTNIVEGTLSPLTISGVSPLVDTLPLTLPAGTVIPAGDTAMAESSAVVLPSMYRLVFDASSGPMSVTVTNNTTGLTLLDVTVGISDNAVAVASGTVSSIAPGAQGTASLAVAGKTIDSTVQVICSATVQGGGTVAAGDEVIISMALNGLQLAEADLLDSLVQFEKIQVQDYSLSDSMNIHFIDIGSAHIHYAMTNGTELQMSVRPEQMNLWNSEYTEGKGIYFAESLGVLNTAVDSQYYYGKSTDLGIPVPPSMTDARIGNINYSWTRLYPTWDAANEQSVSRMLYHMSTSPRGRRITVRSTDAFSFKLIPVSFNYRKLYATFVKRFEKTSDTSYVEVEYPWKQSIIDSLRDKWLFHNVNALVALGLDLNPGSTLESCSTRIELSLPPGTSGSSAAPVTASKLLSDIVRDSVYPFSVDSLQRLLNHFPDTITAVSHITIPPGVAIILTSTIEELNKASGDMKVDGNVDFTLNLRFDWNVASPATVHLENSTFGLPRIITKFRKMEQRRAHVALEIRNSSNIGLTLYALAAPASLRDALLGLDENKVHPSILDQQEGTGFFSLLGDGITVPISQSVDSATVDTFELAEADLEKFLASDTCYIRWRLELPVIPRDVLTDTDFIHVSSWLNLEGIMNMDSLIIW